MNNALTAALIAGGVGVATFGTAAADTINLRMGSGHPIGLLAYTETAHEWFAPELKKRIEERTDHTVNIQELHAGQVAKVTEAALATYAEYPELFEVFETEHNQKWLGGACLANYGVGTDFDWTAFEDLEGHKIAGAGINPDWIAGATPVASNLNEAYQSIEFGVYGRV